VRADFCVSERAACMGCKVFGLRYADAKSAYDWGVCGSAGMRLNAGKRSAVVVFGVGLGGREDAVIRVFVNGYILYVRFVAIWYV
jgi:hypothetical protein